MSRLTSYLESLMHKKDWLKQSATTASAYYYIGGLKIRVSDHPVGASKSDISIINPLNMRTSYLVQIKEGPEILQFSFRELKEFITHYIYISKIKKNHNKVIAMKALSKAKNQENNSKPSTISPSEVIKYSVPLSVYIKNTDTSGEGIEKLLFEIPYTSEGKPWTDLCASLKSKFPFFKSISKDAKRIIREYLFGKSSEEIESILANLHASGALSKPSQLEEYFVEENE